jgi:hypothetical protein
VQLSDIDISDDYVLLHGIIGGAVKDADEPRDLNRITEELGVLTTIEVIRT